jgi:hypothetical protein
VHWCTNQTEDNEEDNSYVKSHMPTSSMTRGALFVPPSIRRTIPVSIDSVTRTTVAAGRCWRADYGTIEPGKVASMLVLTVDPSVSTSAFDMIETVIVKTRDSEATLAAAR